MALKLTKQSLKDWCVEDENRQVLAWVRKVKLGYEVSLKLFDFQGPYFFGTFKEARACALDPTSHPDK
jgi:hypothetical protein